jgi:L-alanine-DL-glutamate epimerase-like enolase superfamily enzyme
VRVDDGPEGVGWAYTVGVGGKAIKPLVDEYLAPLLIGEDLFDHGRCHNTMSRATLPIAGGIASLAVGALDTAIWDARAKTAGLPLYRSLGAYASSVLACGTGIDLNYTREELEAEAREWTRRGYTYVKIKVGRPSVAEDVARVKFVREVVGPSVGIMVDANQALTLSEAVKRGTAFEEFGIEWFEDPLPFTDLEGYQRLSRASSVPIAAGETLSSIAAFKSLIESGAVDIVRADPCRLGGISACLKVAQMAESRNLQVAPHYTEHLSIHIACAIPNIHSVEQIEVCSLSSAGFLKGELAMEDGRLRPPERPGVGAEIDTERIQQWRIM